MAEPRNHTPAQPTSAPPRSPRRHVATTAAYGLVLLSPALAWLLLVSWADGKASDQAHVAWFAGVAAACVAAGALAPRRWLHWRLLGVLGVLSTVTTLYLWWSSQDESGLFLLGIILVAPLVVVAAPILLAAGVGIKHLRR